MAPVRLGVGLMHWPVMDRTRVVVATNITNLDVHDIARVSRVYGVDRYTLIHPSNEQLMFVERLLDHWRIGEGKKFNPMRATALTMVKTANDVDAALRDWDPDAVVIGTTAREIPGVNRASFRELRSFLQTGRTDSELEGIGTGRTGERMRPEVANVLEGKRSLFFVFGTGFGLTEDALKACHLLLEPMRGAPPLDYRHLSVRSAASICLDRLRGTW